ncbi:hypothetical protein, partial [Enterococcus faecium]|uniref:hypothetical protein n=1 Tax=Enterococcus faecium TaxID=1352 RepID=UPI003F43BC32
EHLSDYKISYVSGDESIQWAGAESKLPYCMYIAYATMHRLATRLTDSLELHTDRRARYLLELKI